MDKINSLNDQMVEQLGRLLNAEEQIITGLPDILLACESSSLRIILENHLKNTKKHAERLKEIFSNIKQKSPSIVCDQILGFISESIQIIQNKEKGKTRDLDIITVQQRIKQYEIAEYQKVDEIAVELNCTRIVDMLNEILNDERAMNLHLNELAQGIINSQVLEPSLKEKKGGFYIPDAKFKRKGIAPKKNTEIPRFISEGNPNNQDSS